jgi:glycosyltransferase involved in cell wall biosynthesis
MKPLKKIRVTYILALLDKAIAFEWISERLDRTKYELTFILLNDKPSYLSEYFEKNNVSSVEYLFQSTKDFPRLLWQVTRQLRKWKPDVIHTHMVEADIIGLLAGRICGVKKRIYTRHDANIRRKYHKKGSWIDNFSNKMSTDIFAISKNVQSIMIEQENVPPEKIHLVYHGFDLEQFANVSETEKNALIEKYNPQRKRPVIGVIARYLRWKGIQFIIPAFKRLLDIHPDAILIIANSRKGDYNDQIEQQLIATLPKDSYYEIDFEHNLFALYHLFDVFVHVPIDEEIEAFGQIYVESLAAGIPSVFTKSGIAREFIEQGKNALVVDFQNTEQIYDAITRLLENAELRMQLSKAGKESVKDKFSIESMILVLEQLYAH